MTRKNESLKLHKSQEDTRDNQWQQDLRSLVGGNGPMAHFRLVVTDSKITPVIRLNAAVDIFTLGRPDV